MAIITYPLNGIEYDASDAETYLCTRESGVFSTDVFLATITGAREITIGTGLAWIKNGDYKGKSVVSDENIVLSFTLADGSLARIDRIVLKFDNANNVSTIEVKNGTPSANPVAPAITRTADVYELGLYEVTRPAGSVAITAANIHSTMLDESVCGIMRDSVTGIPTAALYSQFMDWWDDVKGTLDDDAAGNLLNKIEALSTVRYCTLNASDWSGTTPPYVQTVTPTPSGLKPSDNPILVNAMDTQYPNANVNEQSAYTKAFGRVAAGGNAPINSDGTITFKTYKKPATTVIVGLKGV